jgi:hypothetical protein
MQELILSLSIDGGSPQMFSSGLVLVEARFPNITISVDCGAKYFDISLHINASPK